MNKLIIGILILGSMLTVSGCASKSSQDTSNNTQTEQYEIKPDSPNSNIRDNTNDNINKPTTDNKKQTTKSETSKTYDSKKNNSNSDRSKSNNSEVNIKKEEIKNDSSDEKSQNNNSINKEDTTTNNSKDKDNIADSNSTKNNDIDTGNSKTNGSTKKDYIKKSKVSMDSSTSTSNTSSSTKNKKTTIKPSTAPTKEQVEIAKKTSTPSKNKVVKDRVAQNNNESSSDAMQNYYGTWVISEVIGYTKISTNSTSPLNKTLVLNKNSYTNNSFNFTIENSKYLITKISKTSFCNGYKLDSLQGTGLTGDTITALDINSSTNPNSDFDELYIQNGYLVYLQDGVFFKCVKQ